MIRMDKAVLLSIQPQWCEKIASGEKTLEIRKTKPKLQTPFKCYIYCTKSKDKFFWQGKLYRYIDDRSHNLFDKPLNGKVIGEFVCDDISKFTAEFTDGKTYEDIRFYYLDECEEEQEMIICSNEWKNPSDCWLCKQSSLLFEDLRNYIGVNFHSIPFYSWHISDLVIYDKPKQLSEFNINRAPQSWCYVQED